MKYVRAYTYDTARPGYWNQRGCQIQSTKEWFHLVTLLYKLGITVLY
jgi:hypothetical protein